jgi:thioredoxin reductase
MKKVCVIGAGPSGITAAKNLLDEGLDVTVFDYGKDVGGNWVFNEEESHSSVFETTHIISSKKLSEYVDYPMPDTYPDYPSHRQLATYFQNYAKHFELYQHIHFQTIVKNCRLVFAHDRAAVIASESVATEGGKWEVTTEKNGVETTQIFDALAVCNGHHWLPRMPQYEGHFDGEFLHSHNVKRFSYFKEKRVLVIGGGNSACDVSVESSRVAKSVDMSWRRGYWIVPKFNMGMPADILGERLNFLPRWLWSKAVELNLKIRNGSNELYGLPKPEKAFGSHHPTVNEDLFCTIRHGKIKPRPDIARLEGSKVHFKDGSVGEYDVIVACTGYIISHPFFEKSFIDYSEGDVPLWLRMMHPTIENVYFMGLFQPLGCIWPGSELQAKIMAREIAGLWQRPKNIKELIADELKNPDFEQVKTPRHTITVHFQKFKNRLLKQLPKDYVRQKELV